MVLCCLFWCQSVGDVSPYVCCVIFVRFTLLSGHLFGKSCLLGLPVLFKVILVIAAKKKALISCAVTAQLI